MRSCVLCGMDFAAGERLITNDTDAVDKPRYSARSFRVLTRDTASPDVELIIKETQEMKVDSAFWHKRAVPTRDAPQSASAFLHAHRLLALQLVRAYDAKLCFA